MNFKEWFIINEGKEEKALALELADGNPNVISSLSEVIPQNKKDTDPLLLLAAYYYSKNKDVEQIKTDMRDYIGYLRDNRMPLINVDLISKEPPNPWKDYLSWTEVIHGHQGEDAAKKASAFRPSDIDFQNEVPFLKSPDGKIKVYRGHSPQQCIILGKGQSFCISQPGNRSWQSYRDSRTSTFYFVYDDTRDDRLSIVVVDVRGNGEVVLTDKVNRTGKTLDPYTNELTTNSDSYMKYLAKKGIDVSKMVNVPKSDEEIAEEIKLGDKNNKLDWFRSLSHDEKSKYIGRGHRLSDEQFDYLWNNNYNSLLTQYVKTGLKLSDYQIDKVVTDRDLKDNYLHNRLQNGDLTKKEFDLMKDEQKRKLLGSMRNAIKFGSVEDIKALVEKGEKIEDDAVSHAAGSGNLDVVKYLVEKGAKMRFALASAIKSGHLDIVKYFLGDEVELNGEKIRLPKNISKGDIGNAAIMNAVATAAYYNHFDIVKYLVEKGLEIGEFAVGDAVKNGRLDIIKYLVEKGGIIGRSSRISFFLLPTTAVEEAAEKGNLEIVKYFLGDEVELNGEKIKLPENVSKVEIGKALNFAAENGHFDIVKYLVEKGVEIGDAVEYAARNGHHHIADYLKSELEKRKNLK